jgi:leucyl aminopeptidase
MTSFALRTASPAKTRAEAVVVGVVPGDRGRSGDRGRAGTARLAAGGEDVATAYGRRLAPLLASLGLSGKPGEVAKVPTSGSIASPLLVLVGLGADPGPLSVRRAAGAAARAVTNSASVALALPAETPEMVRAVLEGYRLGGYTFTRYKSSASPSAPAELVVLSPAARRKESIAAFDEGQLVVDAVVAARDWVNTPPGDLTPAAFADGIVAAAKPVAGVKAKVYDEAELAELGCGGILGVGAGSDAPPRLVELDYRPAKSSGPTTHLVLVGKGITFDSGGLTIKPAASMPTMKEDMAGAAAVVQAVLTVARLRLPVRVTVIAALAENMVGSGSYRPGDVLTTYDGTTVEISNTDAEGRLVLADALGRAVERKPDLIVDVATLTAHMSLALGDKMCGVMGDDATVERVLAAARAAGEEAWPMPIPEHMEERIRTSKIADLSQHDWIRWGGGLFAAAFLRQFTGGLPWAHLDIAGPAFNKGGPTGYWTSGATGFGVATLVELARSLADPSRAPA